MTCEHGWVRHGPSTMVQLSPVTFPRFYFYHACWGRQEYVLAEMCGFCEPSRRRVAEVTCMARPATCATAFPASPAARRWAECDDVATLRKRGEAYEHAWVKSAARELDLMIEIERLKGEVAAMKETA